MKRFNNKTVLVTGAGSGIGAAAVRRLFDEGAANRRAYAASKYGIVGITQTMALELGSLGIWVNAVAPGMLRTPMTEVMCEDPENEKQIRAAHPIGREGQPEEVAAAIAFLLSDDASFITGVVLPVDGSLTAGIASH